MSSGRKDKVAYFYDRAPSLPFDLVSFRLPYCGAWTPCLHLLYTSCTMHVKRLCPPCYGAISSAREEHNPILCSVVRC